jgi:Ca2+-transporting ATPase
MQTNTSDMPPPASAPAPGLTQPEAARRLASEGPNELARASHRSILSILREVLREPMLLLLLAGGVIYLLFGDLNEALILMVFATFSVLITVVQETRTERVLEALRDLTSPRALVLRDGVRRRIPGREVVRGDIMVLAEGDRVPADARLFEADDLKLDESLLTGESRPVRKLAALPGQALAETRPGGDDLPMVFSGSLVVRGGGLAEVTATGPLSQIGLIGQSLAVLPTEPPRLQAQTLRIVRIFGVVGTAVALSAVLLYGNLRGDWLEAMLAGIAIGMSMLPEEFPVVLTVFMAMGAWRISQARVLTRRAASIESLGSATVLCTDKTGTLTENRMSVQQVRVPGSAPLARGSAAPEMRAIAVCGLLASAPHPFDPMDAAFHDLARSLDIDPGQPEGTALALRHRFGLRPDLLAVTQIWGEAGADAPQVAVCKGAPEAVANLCRLDAAQLGWVHDQANAMAASGMRVLGLARAALAADAAPQSPHEIGFLLLGLVGLADPLRPSVAEAVRECHAAGIRVVMITGDFPETARSIAAEAGLAEGTLVSGDAIAASTPEALRAMVADATVFARVMPEQKLQIVSALKARGEIVAMTGDGVNDAPSLKAAHIGIAMGGRGTDVAREAAGIVLLDDDFGSIVRAIRLGRRIYDNLRKAMGFIFAVHVPIAGMALLPLIFDMPLVFGPLHIAFLEMIIDPVCALVFEAESEEDDIMRRPPRAPEVPLFSTALVLWSLAQGVVAFLAILAVYLTGFHTGLADTDLRAQTFVAVVLVIVGLIYVNRSFAASPLAAISRPNRSLYIVPLAVSVALGVVLLWPFAAGLFGFGALGAEGLVAALAAGVGVFLLLELFKALLAKVVNP